MSNQPTFKSRRDTSSPPTDDNLVAGMASRLHLSEPVAAPETTPVTELEQDIEPSM